MVDKIVFDDITPQEIPVEIGKKQYILREASGEDANKWRDAMAKATKVDKDGRPVGVLDGMAETETLLVSLCLYTTDEQGRIRLTPDGFPDPRYRVAKKTILSWPQKVQKRLYDEAQKMCRVVDGQEKIEENGETTEESIKRQIADLQVKLDNLTRDKEALGNSQSGMTDGSG